MPALYPFLMVPEFHERVWGTRDLRPYYSRPVEGEPIGEVWLSGEDCKVANGPFAGQTLRSLSTQFGAEFTGTASPLPDRFPLLIKFLFPRQKLSVQVHPDDVRAQQIGEPCGKTECWYVARAIEGARVGLGLRPGINRELFLRSIQTNQAEHMLNWLDVHTGEMIYVDAGTVHAIGPNAIFVETQQNCDVTYRLYDYGRPRELHLERGMEAIEEKTHAGLVDPAPIPSLDARGQHQTLVASPCFVVERHTLQAPLTLAPGPGLSSVQAFVSLDGGAVVECPGSQPITFMRGECVVVPASSSTVTLRPQWSAEILRMRLPAETVAHPATNLHTGSVISHS